MAKSNKTNKKAKQSKKLEFEGNTHRKGEGQLFDKIMRENLLALFCYL